MFLAPGLKDGAAVGQARRQLARRHHWPLKSIPVFSTLGKNALVIFMIASVFIKVLNVLLPEESSLAAIVPTAVALEVLCIAAARLLEKRRIFMKL